MYYLFRFGTLVLPWMPRWLVLAVGRVIGLLAWLLANKARKQATRNMMHVLSAHVLETRARRRRLRHTVREMFQHNVRNYLEVCTLPSLDRETILQHMYMDGVEHVDAALVRGKGLVLFSAHLGPFDYMVQYAICKGYDVTIPVERLKDERMLNLMLRLRGSHGVQFLPLEGSSSMRKIVQRLRDNQIVLIAVDRVVQGQSVEVPFFDAPARLPIGPVLLAQRTGAALVGTFGWRVSNTRMYGECVPLSFELTEEQRANTDYVMRAMIKKMEYFIGTHPEQWMAFAPIWTDE